MSLFAIYVPFKTEKMKGRKPEQAYECCYEIAGLHFLIFFSKIINYYTNTECDFNMTVNL
jgi:hypothetical protein